MERTLVLVQLTFNVLMFIALVALACRVRGPAERRRTPSRRPLATTPAAAPVAAGVTATLADLVAGADAKELAAEAELRRRLERFRQRAVS